MTKMPGANKIKIFLIRYLRFVRMSRVFGAFFAQSANCLLKQHTIYYKNNMWKVENKHLRKIWNNKWGYQIINLEEELYKNFFGPYLKEERYSKKSGVFKYQWVKEIEAEGS